MEVHQELDPPLQGPDADHQHKPDCSEEEGYAHHAQRVESEEAGT